IKNINRDKIVAIGETGLDFYHKPFFKQRQTDAFRAHIELALELNMPVSVHIRESVDDVYRLIEEYAGDLRGVLHCFCQNKAEALQAIEWGFLLGVGGPVTYPKNDDLREIIKEVPLKSIVLETDAPFLPPQQYRGKQNRPAYIPLIAKKIAEVRGVSVDEVERVTSNSAERLLFLSNASALV
ncbi:TatD family hydrolase, partial [Candidatus Babeliales bacterium]|nr:TatD family hydrolase [Candidatus Babeliales bacterium]